MTTTSMTGADRLPWWRYLGPWPLRPGAMFFTILVIGIATTASQIRVSNLLYYFLSAVLLATACSAGLWLFQRFTPQWSQRPLGYLTALAAIGAAGVTVRRITGTWLPIEAVPFAVNLLILWARSVLFAAMALAILGVTSRRLQIQVDRTEQALTIVREQADALLRADEVVRQQVATLLHDKVQAGLIAACLHLQDIRRRIPEDERQSVGEIVASLERIRALDVRRAVHSLSPNLAEVDFESALKELTEFYEPTMTTSIDLDLEESAPHEIRLGAYRIIEQALLNAAAHGSARHCQIEVRERDGQVHIDVRNDGSNLPRTSSPGLGTTLTSTWCRTLGGTWERRNDERGGVHLSARLPLPS